jgi:hypothetical protein
MRDYFWRERYGIRMEIIKEIHDSLYVISLYFEGKQIIFKLTELNFKLIINDSN